MSFFDLRIPLGGLFLSLGALLVIAGLRGSESLGININLIWGAVLILFALVCLWLGYRASRRRSDRPKS